MNISLTELMTIIGEKEVTIKILNSQLAESQKKNKELTDKYEPKKETR